MTPSRRESAPSLAESILFGHERGSFTGADQARLSPFVEAANGTVFIDELGELPLDIQPKLLRALAEKRVKPVGSNTYVPFQARVVAATRRDLLREVNEGRFRSDLYFRMAQVRLEVPPLRDRKEDVPLLLRAFLSSLGDAAAFERIPRTAMERLLRHDWPGNVRELKNALTVAYALCPPGSPLDVAGFVGQPIASGSLERIGDYTAEGKGYHAAKRDVLSRFEREYFNVLLTACGGNFAEIARRSGLQRTHVRKYVSGHGLMAPRPPKRKAK